MHTRTTLVRITRPRRLAPAPVVPVPPGVNAQPRPSIAARFTLWLAIASPALAAAAWLVL